MKKEQAQKIAEYINANPRTVFYNAKIQQNIHLGDDGYYVEANDISEKNIRFDNFAEFSEMHELK